MTTRREIEIEIQMGRDARTIYVAARNNAEALRLAFGSATTKERKWGRFVLTGR